MPIDYNRYPPDWKLKRAAVLERANHECEFCGAVNYEPHPVTGSRVVLTVAHLDHDEDNWKVTIDRLRALCQRCHNRYDAKERARRRKIKKAHYNTGGQNG